MLELYVSSGVAVASFVLSEFFFPRTSKLPHERDDTYKDRQKEWRRARRFWAGVLCLGSSVLAYSIVLAHSTQAAVSEVSDVFRSAADESVEDSAANILKHFHDNFQDDQHPIAIWARESIDHFEEQMSQGQVSMPFEQAIGVMGKMYSQADKWILAINVGSTRSFFDNKQTYKEHNLAAARQGTPVVRLFLYSKSRRINLRNGVYLLEGQVHRPNKAPINGAWQAFREEVETIHTEYETEVSYPVNVDKNKSISVYYDALIVDGEFAAFFPVNDAWEAPNAVTASMNETILRAIKRCAQSAMNASEEKNKLVREGSETSDQTLSAIRQYLNTAQQN